MSIEQKVKEVKPYRQEDPLVTESTKDYSVTPSVVAQVFPKEYTLEQAYRLLTVIQNMSYKTD